MCSVLGAALVSLPAGCGTAADELAVTVAWARPTPAGAVDGVIYLTLTSDREDTVLSVATSPARAAGVELHESMLSTDGSGHQHGGSGGGDTHADGTFAVGPGNPLVLRPGGRHVMLRGLLSPLRVGDTFDVVVTLRSGRVVAAPVVVGENAPAGT